MDPTVPKISIEGGTELTSEEFVEAVRLYVVGRTADAVVKSLTHPVGRSPRAELVRQSEWFNERSPEEKALIEGIVGDSVRSGVFQLLCVLDGECLLEDGAIGGSFELHYVQGGQRTRLNDPPRAVLHDLLNA